MIRTGLMLLLLIASVWLGVQFHGDPGYVLVVIRNWSIESTLWVALFAMFVLFSLLHLLLLSYRKTAYIPIFWHHWRLKHRAERARDKTTKGLIEFSEGYWKAAKTHLIQALPHTETPLINYLIAARAAQELGDTKLRDNYLREAQHSMPDAKIAVELTQAQLQLAHQQWEQALATLRHLHDLAPKHPYVLKLLANLYEAIEDWDQLITLLPSITRFNALSSKQLKRLTHIAYVGEVKRLIAQEAWEALDTQVEHLPKALKQDAVIIAHYAQALITQNESVRAEMVLRRALQKQLIPELLEMYTQLPPSTVRLSAIETLLKQHPHAAILHYCLGKLYTYQQLFGKAETHLKQSIEIKPSPENYQALGHLLSLLKDSKGALDAYKKGLEQALTAQQ
ncbi:MAG: heme biosynthesis HemY N-terminal domain-containing protein [Legionellaceae bacterium]|nr:heme biosynthesis HemY N-terminal domain-containing protein [Legionellaceae bacterium]